MKAKNSLGGYGSRDQPTEPIRIQILDSLVFLSQSFARSFAKDTDLAGKRFKDHLENHDKTILPMNSACAVL